MRISFIPGPGTSQLTVLEEDANHVALAYGNVLVVFWYGRLEPNVCTGLYDWAVRVARISGAKRVGAVSVALQGSSPPSKLTRLALERLHEDAEQVVYRSAFVPPGGGFIEAAVRSVVLGLRRRLTRRDSHQVMLELGDAVAWVTEGLEAASGVGVDARALLDELRAYQHPRSSSHRPAKTG